MNNTTIEFTSSLSDLGYKRIAKTADQKPTGFTEPTASVKVVATSGFHIYSRLRLKMEMEAPESESRIRRFLEVIKRYAEIATSLVNGEDLVLLELQGETLHLFVRKDLSPQNSVEAIALVAALHSAIEREVKILAGDAWRSLRFTMDHGDTILVDSSQNIDDSIISLAPAANEPAKQFKHDYETFPAGCLRTRRTILDIVKQLDASVSYHGEKDGWASIKVDDASDRLMDELSYASYVSEFADRIRNNLVTADIQAFTNITINRSFNRFTPGSIGSPLALRGWTLRADVDGFSTQVSIAFQSVEKLNACKQLVQEFIGIMDDTGHFDKGCPFTTVALPWAGDCASRFIVSTDAAYSQQAMHVPAQVQLRWQEYTKSGRWLCSLAGGNAEEGNGYTLIAELEIQNRRFQIAGGWGIRRSKQGEQDIGGEPTECVMHANDVAELTEAWKRPYRPVEAHPSFAKASFADLKQAQNQAQQLLDKTIDLQREKSYIVQKPYYAQDQ
jgi:hypothetical protein